MWYCILATLIIFHRVHILCANIGTSWVSATKRTGVFPFSCGRTQFRSFYGVTLLARWIRKTNQSKISGNECQLYVPDIISAGNLAPQQICVLLVLGRKSQSATGRCLLDSSRRWGASICEKGKLPFPRECIKAHVYTFYAAELKTKQKLWLPGDWDFIDIGWLMEWHHTHASTSISNQHSWTYGTYPSQSGCTTRSTSSQRRRKQPTGCEGRSPPPAARRNLPWCRTGRKPSWPCSPPGEGWRGRGLKTENCVLEQTATLCSSDKMFYCHLMGLILQDMVPLFETSINVLNNH